MSRKERREQEEREEKARRKNYPQRRKRTKRPQKQYSAQHNRINDDIEEIEISVGNTPMEKHVNTHKSNNQRKPNGKKKKKKESLFLKVIKKLFLLLFGLFLTITLIVGIYFAKLGFENDWNLNRILKQAIKEVTLFVTHQTEEDVKNLKPIYCLVLGVSTDEGNLLTDTIILCAYYPRTQQASMLSIPRDTFVGRSEAYAGGYDKINSLYQAGGGGDAGARKILAAVEDLTGLEINNYLAVENDGLIDIINAIGGVEFTVPIDMDYDDPGQNLHIHLSQGYQHIDGPKAEQLLRFRHNNNGTSYPASYGDNDIGRMRTQREFITETIKQTIQVKNVTKINDLIKIAFNNIDTNLNMDYVLKYSPAAIDFDVSSIQTAYLPGEPTTLGPQNLWFYRAYRMETKELVEEMFTFKENSSEAQEANEAGTAVKPEYLQIQLLNAASDKKAFEDTKNRLEEKGYKIISTGETTYSKTTKIINRTEKNKEVISGILNTIGYGEESKGKDTRNCDITIIVGDDMKQLMVSKK